MLDQLFGKKILLAFIPYPEHTRSFLIVTNLPYFV